MKKQFANSIGAGLLAAGLSMAAVAVGVVATVVPASAQATLSVAQISAIQSSLQKTLTAAMSDSAKQDAIAQAIQSGIGLYGADFAAMITSVVMQTAEAASTPANVIGTGIAQASVALAATNAAAADAIAAAIANEGKLAVRTSYQVAVIRFGYPRLASVSEQGPTVTGATDATGATGGTGGIGLGGTGGGLPGSNPGGGGGGCLNPSCTKL